MRKTYKQIAILQENYLEFVKKYNDVLYIFLNNCVKRANSDYNFFYENFFTLKNNNREEDNEIN